jgi:hypothetical protein
MMWIVDTWKNITNSQNSVRKKSIGGTFSFSNCHIIGQSGLTSGHDYFTINLRRETKNN